MLDALDAEADEFTDPGSRVVVDEDSEPVVDALLCDATVTREHTDAIQGRVEECAWAKLLRVRWKHRANVVKQFILCNLHLSTYFQSFVP